MNLHDLSRSLYEQARDREALVPPEEPDSIFAQDAQALREAQAKGVALHAVDCLVTPSSLTARRPVEIRLP